MASSVTRTTCPYCGVGCGVLATRKADGTIGIAGDPAHPANFGKLCSKGLALGETLGHGQRLLSPMIGGRPAGWQEATQLVAEKFSAAIRGHGPDSVAFYVSGQFLTEDYYVANKLMKGFIGSANIDTNSRLCMASAVAGHMRAFGADIVPCSYSDLEEAGLVVLAGSNLAWCHPVLFMRLQAAREKRGTKLVVIDPRRTMTAESADLFLQIAPGTDVALFNGLLRHLHQTGAADPDFVFNHTSGLSAALLAANQWTVETVAGVTGLPQKDVQSFYDLYATHDRTVTGFSMGVNQSATGTDKVNAIINCHLATGRIGKAGSGPFSITGQPNAMGGREVGGMANMLAAHMDIANGEHRAAVQDFWASPRIADRPGLKAVDLFEAVRQGKIKALWIMATNPAVSMPDATYVVEALKACPFVAVSDVTANTDTAKHAHVLLPATGWSEKDGTVTNSERHISRQRRFMPPAGAARDDWRIICGVAKAMGFAGFDFQSPAAIFAEHAALTQVGNNGSRRLDLSAWVGLSPEHYDALEPAQWGGERPFAGGCFETPDGKARFEAAPFEPLPSLEEGTLTLNTGRIRDQWHTMTRTGLVPRLFGHRAEPHVEVSPADARRLSLGHAELATVSGSNGKSILRVMVTDAVTEGQIFQPMHWNRVFASEAIANNSTRPTVDPVSGQPALKSAPVRIKRFATAWYGFGISLGDINPCSEYWAMRPLFSGLSFECAGSDVPADWAGYAGTFLKDGLDGHQVSSVHGTSPVRFRCAAFKDGALRFAFFASPQPVEVSRHWLQLLLGTTPSPMHVLAGRPSQAVEDCGPILCSCMGVGRNSITSFVAMNRGASLSAVCEMTGAGTGCGSCRPEILKLIREPARYLQAAE